MMEKIKVHGKSLEGNLEGDSPDRDVLVYLPSSYSRQPNRRYPLVYFLHGYTVGAQVCRNMMAVPQAADKHEMILVHSDAFTVCDGSMYSSSLTTGDWESCIAQDLVAYIDTHYPLPHDRKSR
jgi:S-formylglutathione hydrolase FrmB